MKARFSSSCDSCGDQIRPGKEIAKNSSGKWVHKHCCEDYLELP